MSADPSAKIKQLSQENFLLQRKSDLLEQIISVMNTTSKVEGIVSYILDLVCMTATCEAAFVLIKEKPDADDLIFKGVSGVKNKKKVLGSPWPVGVGIAGEIYCSGAERTVNDVGKDSSFVPKINDVLGLTVRNVVALPLISEGRTVGSLEAVNKKDGLAFNKDDVELIRILATQAANIAGQETSMKTVEAKVKRFNTLIETSKEITSVTDLGHLLDKIMTSAKVVMRAEASSLFLLDTEKNELYATSAQGDVGELIKSFSFPVGKGIAGWVAQHSKADLVKDAYDDKRFNPEFDKKTGFRTKSVLCVPMEYKKRTTGVIQIINAIDKEVFDEDDMEFMNAMSGQCAIAIENARQMKDNKDFFLNVIMAMVRLIDAKFKHFNGHSVRVAKYAVAIGRVFGLQGELVEKLQTASLIHDIGRIHVPEGIIMKRDKLTPPEIEIVRKMPLLGASILKGVKMLDNAIPAILYHQEHFNGKGYPKGLSGEQIPLLARIIGVANAFDAMCSPRPYREAIPPDKARTQIMTAAGGQFDPAVVKAFGQAWEKGLLK